jgi:hypothetical protein
LPQASFTAKQMRVTFTLTNSGAVFAGSGNNNVLTLTGLRMRAVIKGAGVPAFPEATLKIFGMAQADMNALAIVQVDGGQPGYFFNSVKIEANSSGTPDGWSTVFAGQIITAGPDYDALPNACLSVSAVTGGFDLLNPATPTSYPGTATVDSIVSTIAQKLTVAYQNNGVTGTLTKTYLSGTLSDQLRTVAQQANIDFTWDQNQNLIVISPKGSPLGIARFTLSPSSGLVGYPKVLGNGYIQVRSFYNPAFRTKAPLTIVGSDVVVDTQPGFSKALNSAADGDWIIGPMTNTIDALEPNANWFSDMTCYPASQPGPSS